MSITKNHNSPFSGGKYYYQTPFWAVVTLLSLTIIFAILCFVIFFNWPNDDPVLVKWIVLIIGLVTLSAGFRPLNWQAWIYFYADDEGIHFPSKCPKTKDATWLLVPWVNVGSIKNDLFYGRKKGISIELVLKDIEIEHYFRNLKLTKVIFGQEVRENGFFTVGYSNLFNRIDTAVNVLNEFKQKNT